MSGGIRKYVCASYISSYVFFLFFFSFRVAACKADNLLLMVFVVCIIARVKL